MTWRKAHRLQGFRQQPVGSTQGFQQGLAGDLDAAKGLRFAGAGMLGCCAVRNCSRVSNLQIATGFRYRILSLAVLQVHQNAQFGRKSS